MQCDEWQQSSGKWDGQVEEPWRIELFGGLRARRGGTEINRFATSRVVALLARLALFPRHPHPREELADLLWPDADPEAGRLNLRVALASLRKQLGPPGVLEADRSAVRLLPQACRTDVADFEAALREAARASEAAKKRDALDQAMALYAGELLPGFYDEWILEERERLEALYEDACDQRRALPAPAREEEKAGRKAEGKAEAPRGFPAQGTRFFGREAECARLTHWLSDAQTRLVTLTGPGGAGKTRLAGEAAQSAASGFPGPVCFVALADLPDAHFLPGAVGQALGLPPSPTQEPLEQVVAALAAQAPALLVLDNFEHLAERGTPAVLALLTRLPTLTCLVTSRRRLGLPGERQFPVSPLELPEPEWEAGRIGGTASARLFVDRAQAANPGFRLTPGNAPDVATLCRRLEGLPLAIELVAARAQSLTPAQMNERLAHRFELLTSRRGDKNWDKNGRHRSLWAAIAWSYDLLPPDLRRFFVRLSAFRGGWTAEAAAFVCGEPEALELLTQLRERSLVVAEESGNGMRFRLLESLREFGEEGVPGVDRQALARSHADYFETRAGQMNTFRVGPEKGRVLAMLDAEGDNLRAALAFCRADPPGGGWDGVGVGLRMSGALGDYWTARGMLREGLGWLDGALAGGGAGAVRAKAAAEAGWLAAGLGEYDRAEASLSEAVEIGRGLEDRSLLAYALRLRGVAALWREDNARATVDLEEGLALCRALGDDAGTASALNNLGVLARQWRGDNAGAQVLYEEAMTFFRRCGDVQRTSYGLYNLGSIARDLGEYDRAEGLLREGLALTDELGDFWQRAYCLRTLGDVALARGDLAGARRLLEEGRDLARRLGDRMTEAGILDSLVSVARRQGDLARAASVCRDALALYRDVGNAHGVDLCLTALAGMAGEAEE